MRRTADAGIRSSAFVALVLVVLVHCAGQRHQSGSPSIPGQVQGGIVFAGGPKSTAGNAGPVYRMGTVKLSASGSVIAHAELSAGKTFDFSVPAGKYTLGGSSGDARCAASTVTVFSATITKANLICSVK
jgi:hypothetical protein